MKVRHPNPQGLRRENKTYICMLDIDLRRVWARGNFLCDVSIYSMLTFELWAMRGGFYKSLSPKADFLGMKLPQQGLVSLSQAFLLFPSLSLTSHEALSCLINFFPPSKEETHRGCLSKTPRGPNEYRMAPYKLSSLVKMCHESKVLRRLVKGEREGSYLLD